MRTLALPVPFAMRRAHFVLLFVAAAGCASAEKRFEQGLQLEQEGRPAEAADRYVDALRKDPSLADARFRLRESGDAAIRDALTASSAHEAAGRWADAAESLRAADELSGRAASVGVPLALPADFGERRRALFDRAIAEALVASRTLAGEGSHDEADRRLALALERYAPSPRQSDELLRARNEVNVGAAEADLRAGRYRAAYARVEEIRRWMPAGAPELAEPALRVQDEALRLGTRRLVVLPVIVERAQAERLPDDFERDLDFALEDGEWRRPPLFVEVVDPSRARAAFRRRDSARRGLSDWDAAGIGRESEAHLVLVAEVDSVWRGVQRSDTVRRPVRTRAGQDTAYRAIAGREEISLRVRWRLVDADLRREVESGRLWGRTGATFERAEYAGDPRTLTLTRQELARFEPWRADEKVERELARELIDEMAPDLAREVFGRVQSLVR